MSKSAASLVFVFLCAVDGVGTAAGRQAHGGGGSAAAPAAIPLREVKSVAFAERYFAWIDPMQCDQDGNLYAIPIQPAAAGNRAAGPRTVLRIGADGKDKTTFDPLSIPDFVRAEEIQALGATLGADGTLSLVPERVGEKST